MHEGRSLNGTEFFDYLCSNDSFCKQLGRAILIAGRLETELTIYFNNRGIAKEVKSLTLGKLIALARQHSLLNKMLPALETLKIQINYLTHNIYALFTGLIEETILERNNLLDSNVELFTERAYQLKQNIQGLYDILAN